MAARAAQLIQVQELLLKDPANAELVALERDLRQVVDLENDLALERARGATRDGSAAQMTASALAAEWRVGTSCEAFFQARWFAASVVASGADGGARVRFFGYGNVVDFPRGSQQIRALSGGHAPSLAKGSLGPGAACQAVYSVDRAWYDAAIVAPTEHGFRVKFTQYGNEEEVPVEYVRLPGSGSSAADAAGATSATASGASGAGVTSSSGSDAVRELDTAQLFSKQMQDIPESLKFCNTDTEKEKARKKKRVKAIKSRNRNKVKDLVIQKKQSSWKSFQKKTKGKKGVGVASIFVSPDGVDGKVGVVGSGQGMSTIVERKKYQLNN
jgi:survival-of-motor-neuron-related-splicing factor 30